MSLSRFLAKLRHILSLRHLKSAAKYFQSDYQYQLFHQGYKGREELIARQQDIPYRGKRLLAFYDLLELPYTNDIASFIINAETDRRNADLEKTDIVIVGNSDIPSNPDYETRINTQNAKLLVENVLLEYCKLFPSIGAILYFDNRNQVMDYFQGVAEHYQIFPRDYDPKRPYERLAQHHRGQTFQSYNLSHYCQADSSYNCLQPSRANVQLVRKWLARNAKPKIPITITLRETEVDKKRGSNIPEWQKLIDAYAQENKDYVFIIMRDYYYLYDEDVLTGDNVVYCNEATLNMGFRAALHQEVTLNLFINNGVNVVSIYSRLTRYLMFKMHTPGVGSASYRVIEETTNMTPGKNWHGSTKYQKYIWEDDTCEVMKSETDKMLDVLESDGLLIPPFYCNDAQNQDDQNQDWPAPPEPEPAIAQPPSESMLYARTPIQTFMGYYHILRWCKRAKDLLSRLPGVPRVRAINELKLNDDFKVVLYGAGTVARSLLKQYRQYVVAIVDQNAGDKLTDIDGVSVYPVTKLPELAFSHILVTPKMREMDIVALLRREYGVSLDRVLVEDVDVLIKRL